MNSQVKTIKQIIREHKVLGHAMSFGCWVIATNRIWNDERATYDHFATLYKRTDAEHAIHMTDSDEAFVDEGHATAWAIGIASTYDADRANCDEHAIR